MSLRILQLHQLLLKVEDTILQIHHLSLLVITELKFLATLNLISFSVIYACLAKLLLDTFLNKWFLIGDLLDIDDDLFDLLLGLI